MSIDTDIEARARAKAHEVLGPRCGTRLDDIGHHDLCDALVTAFASHERELAEVARSVVGYHDTNQASQKALAEAQVASEVLTQEIWNLRGERDGEAEDVDRHKDLVSRLRDAGASASRLYLEQAHRADAADRAVAALTAELAEVSPPVCGSTEGLCYPCTNEPGHAHGRHGPDDPGHEWSAAHPRGHEMMRKATGDCILAYGACHYCGARKIDALNDDRQRLTVELAEVRRASEVRIAVLSAAADTACVLEAERDRLKSNLAVLNRRFDCATCGTGVVVDEDGCCAQCGAGATISDVDAPEHDGTLGAEPAPDLRAGISRLTASLASMTVERDEAVKKLGDAAQSLETCANWTRQNTDFCGAFFDLRGYASSRATAARAALAGIETPKGETP